MAGSERTSPRSGWRFTAGHSRFGRENGGTGIERNFGFDTIEMWLTLDESASTQLAAAVQDEVKGADEALSPGEVIGLWLAGDSAASAHLRLRLDALGLDCEFRMR